MLILRSIERRGYVHDFGCVILVSEILFFMNIYSNLHGKNGERQYLVGSFTGAVSS